MSAVPHDILAALDRLNAHARAKRGGCWGNEARAIYAYKQLAATLMIRAGAAQVRLIKVEVACGCDRGLFTIDYDLETHQPIKVKCRYCPGTGTRMLRFTETAFPDATRPGGGSCIAWHHPWEGRVRPGLDLARAAFPAQAPAHNDNVVPWCEAGDWTPLQAGRALPVDELVPLINTVEAWLDENVRSTDDDHVRWPLKDARRMLGLTRHARIVPPLSAPYRLDLGHADGDCWVCGRADDLANCNLGCLSLFFHWSLPVCHAHHRNPRPGMPPDALITPAVREWVARHERIVDVQ